jgi:hypothetical protein
MWRLHQELLDQVCSHVVVVCLLAQHLGFGVGVGAALLLLLQIALLPGAMACGQAVGLPAICASGCEVSRAALLVPAFNSRR